MSAPDTPLETAREVPLYLVSRRRRRARRLLETAPVVTRLDAVRSAVAAFGQARDLHARHYRFDVVRDPAARAAWVAPHLVTKQDK